MKYCKPSWGWFHTKHCSHFLSMSCEPRPFDVQDFFGWDNLLKIGDLYHPVIKHGTNVNPHRLLAVLIGKSSKNWWGLSSHGWLPEGNDQWWEDGGTSKREWTDCQNMSKYYCNRNDSTIILESILMNVPNNGEVSNNHVWWLWWHQFQKVA